MGDNQSQGGRTTRRRFLATTSLGVGAVTLAGCSGGNGNGDGSAPGSDGNLVMTTSGSSTSAYAASQGISAAIEENSDGSVSVDARPSEGTDANVGRLARKETDLGYIQNWTANRIRQEEGPFSDLGFQPVQVFHLYNLPWIFATANDGWRSITDIQPSSRIVPTPKGSGTRPALEHGLEYAIKNYEVTSIQYGELASALSEGRIDAAAMTILNGDIEPGWVQEMKSTVDLRLLDWPQDAVSKMEEDPGLIVKDVDMTGFDGYAYTPDSIPAITFAYNFISRHDLHYDTLYAFLETLFEARSNLSEYNALLGYLKEPEYWVSNMYEGIPFHPAAADFYMEKGLWKDEFTKYEA